MTALALTARGLAPGQDRALAWSLAGHGLLLVLVLVGGSVIPRSQPLTQLAIKATIVDPRALRRPLVLPPAPVKPEVKPERPAEPQPEIKPEARDEERRGEEARRAAQQKQQQDKAEAAAVAKRVEARKKEQALQDKQRAEQKKAQQAAERAKADAERAQAERLKVARLKEEAAQREIARQLEEEEQLENPEALARYGALIRQKIERNWSRPPTALAGLECEVSVTQIPGGQVTAVRTERCNADDAVRRSIEAAVLKASPLPLPDDARLFERNLRFTFKPEQ